VVAAELGRSAAARSLVENAGCVNSLLCLGHMQNFFGK
jgi:hypothetical protein